jgi:hypothetical protein
MKGSRRIFGLMFRVAALDSNTKKMNPFQMRLANEIMESVSKYYQITVSEITEKRRHAKIVRARQVAAYLLREDLRLSLHEVGAIINRDHSSVVHAHKTIREMTTPNIAGVFADKTLVMEISDIRHLCKSTWSRQEIDEIEYQIERLTARRDELLRIENSLES